MGSEPFEAADREARLQLLLADGRTLTWALDLATGVLSIDPLAERWLGRDPAAPPLTAADWFAALESSDSVDARREVDECAHGLRPFYEHEASLRRADGEVLTVVVRGSFVRDASGHLLRSIGIATDVSELRAAARGRREHEARLRAILDASMDAVLLCLDSGEILAAGRVAQRLLEMTENELVGRELASVLNEPGQPGQPPAIWGERLGTVPLRKRQEARATRRDGTSTRVDCSIAEARIGPRPVFAVVLHDLAGSRDRTLTPVQGVRPLKQTRELREVVVERVPLGAVTVDRDGQLTAISDACRTIGGLEDLVREALAHPGAVSVPARRLGRPVRLELEVRADVSVRGRRHVVITELPWEAPSSSSVRTSLVGDGPAMRKLRAAIDQVAGGDWTVLVEGETGSGKELVARAIHDASARRQGPFVPVNCAGLTESLLGSQFFGHAKGAFTGATADLPGLFEAASGGTLFLDEIGDISPEAQKTLLRVLEDRTIRRLGEMRPRRVDLRIVSATNRDLARQVAAGAFREDLLYRIRVARVRVPPLRERLEDIPALVDRMLSRRSFASRLVTGVSPEAMARLSTYAWPGNVRELRSAIEHAVIHCTGQEVEVDDLPPELVRLPDPAAPTPIAEPADERTRILEALRRAGGNRSRAARLLGIGRATLYRRLDELGLDLGPDGDLDPDPGRGRPSQ